MSDEEELLNRKCCLNHFVPSTLLSLSSFTHLTKLYQAIEKNQLLLRAYSSD
jgi:hypothetical protein